MPEYGHILLNTRQNQREKRMKALFFALFALLTLPSVQAVELGDDGLHKQPWFETTFKDIHEDIESARDLDKRLAIFVEQRGCPFCKKMHETVLIDPEIVAYIEQHYFIVQYNLHGGEEVTDLDGDVLSENEAAQKWGLKYTPTLLFFPESAEDDQSAAVQAVAGMPGAADKETTYSMLRWVVERGYSSEESFESFHKRRLKEAKNS